MVYLKNWIVDKYNPDYYYDFEDATTSTMTNNGSATAPTFTSSPAVSRFGIETSYYGMWPSAYGVLNNGTRSLVSTTANLGNYLDNGDYTINFFATWDKVAVANRKNLLEFNYASNVLLFQLLGNNFGADSYKLRIRSNGVDIYTSTDGHWSNTATPSGGFLDTPTGWNSNRPGFAMITLRQISGNIELYINGQLDGTVAFTNPSGAFTNFRIFGTLVSWNIVFDALVIGESTTFTQPVLEEIWNMYLLGEIPVEPMLATNAVMNSVTVSITNPNVSINADEMIASALFENPTIQYDNNIQINEMTASALINNASVSIGEINTVSPAFEATAVFKDPAIQINTTINALSMTATAEFIEVVQNVSINSVPLTASANSGDHLYSWYHIRPFKRRDKVPSGTDAIYDTVNVFSSQNLWFYQAQIDDYSRITSTTSLYFKPELSGIASGSVVKALIKVGIYNFITTSGTSILDMYRTTGAWSLDTIIDSNQPAASLVTNDYSFSWTSGDFHYIDVTDLYNNLASNSNTGFYISLSSGNGVYFDLENFPDFQLDLYLNTPPVNAIIAANPATADAKLAFGNIEVLVNPALANAEFPQNIIFPNISVFVDEMLASAEFPPTTNGIAEINVAPAMSGEAYMYYLPLTDISAGTASGVSRYTNVYHRVLYSLNNHTVNNVDQQTDTYWVMVPDISEGQINYIQKRTPAGSTIRQPIYSHWFGFQQNNLNNANQINLGVGGNIFAGDGAATQVFKIPFKVGDKGYVGDSNYIQYPTSGFGTKPFEYTDTGPGYTWQFKFDGESFLRIPEFTQFVDPAGAAVQNYMTGSYYGSFEVTIRTDQNNCVLLSPSVLIKPTVDGDQILPRSEDSKYIQAEFNSIRSENPYTVFYDWYHRRGLEYAFLDADEYVNYASSDMGRNYGDIRIVDGKVAFYHKDQLTKTETLVVGSTLINDLENHHIIINRTVDGFGNMNNFDKDKKSRLEIWVDGNLEAVSYEINDKIWINRFSQIGVGWEFQKSGNPENGEVTVFRPQFKESEAFTGYMQDYIARSNRPLTEIEIQRLSRARFEIIAKKAETLNATSLMNKPTVITNAKNILRLYWDTDKYKDGTSFVDDNYNIYTYNVAKTTYNNPSDLFNLDSNSNLELKEIEEVVALTDRYIFLSDPSVFLIDPGNIANQFALGTELVTTTRPRKYHPEFIVDNVAVNNGDRFAVTGQTDPRQNGVYIYNGRGKPAIRAIDANSAKNLLNCYFYVRNGENYSDTYWTCISKNTTQRDQTFFGGLIGQNSPLEFKQISDDEINVSSPIYNNFYSEGIAKNPRFIDINNDLPFDFDIITFINYPETSAEILSSLGNHSKQHTQKKYKEFLENILIAVENGKNLLINSPTLTQDLGIAQNIVKISQEKENNDLKSQAENLFDLTTTNSKHFDNYRNNRYRVLNTLSGLTNLNTYIMTDFINYIPEQPWLSDEYHIKYTHKENGLTVGDEFIIPTLPLREEQLNLIKSDNQKNSNILYGVLNSDILVGTSITSFSQNYYVENTTTANPYANYITTIAIDAGSVVQGKTITGKIFVNLVEDGLTSGRKDYNFATIQNVPNTEETAPKRLWQYSTSRIKKDTLYLLEQQAYNIQRLPTDSGGGPIVQMPTNITKGIIRNNYDTEYGNAFSTEYNSVENEIYTTTKVSCLSMVYMGLKWLGG